MGDDFISPLVIRSQPPLAEEPEKLCIGLTVNESEALYLHFPGTGGTAGRMECFNRKAVATRPVEAGNSLELLHWGSFVVTVHF